MQQCIPVAALLHHRMYQPHDARRHSKMHPFAQSAIISIRPVSGAIRAAIGIVLFVALLFGAYTTLLGQQTWAFFKLSRNEMRKVVWPTKQETTQTTIMVVVIVLLTAVVLWLFDMFFQWFVYSFLLG